MVITFQSIVILILLFYFFLFFSCLCNYSYTSYIFLLILKLRRKKKKRSFITRCLKYLDTLSAMVTWRPQRQEIQSSSNQVVIHVFCLEWCVGEGGSGVGVWVRVRVGFATAWIFHFAPCVRLYIRASLGG